MQTLLIVGLGDIARRAISHLQRHWRILAMVRSPEQQRQARALGIIPILADLDCPGTLKRLAGLADALLYTAPPPSLGTHDSRMVQLLSALRKARRIPHRIVYISTSGVYGDYDGGWVNESSPLKATTARAQRRISAERQLRRLCRHRALSVTILRAPAIYAAERLPLTTTPIAFAEEDRYSNRIHADDLAALCARALRRRGGVRIYNASDSLPIKYGHWRTLLAAHFGLPPPQTLPRAALLQALSPEMASYFAESRRLDNSRIKRELGASLCYDNVFEFLSTLTNTRSSAQV